MGTPLTERILELCREMNLSQRQLSLRAGLGPETVNQIIRNPTSRPRADTLQAIAKVLKTDPLDLMRRAGYSVPEPSPSDRIPRLGKLVERLVARPPAEQDRIIEAFLMLLEVRDAVNEPQEGVLREVANGK